MILSLSRETPKCWSLLPSPSLPFRPHVTHPLIYEWHLHARTLSRLRPPFSNKSCTLWYIICVGHPTQTRFSVEYGHKSKTYIRILRQASLHLNPKNNLKALYAILSEIPLFKKDIGKITITISVNSQLILICFVSSDKLHTRILIRFILYYSKTDIRITKSLHLQLNTL